MAPLGVGEVEPVEQPACLCGVVVRDGRLEVLALRRRLAKLAAEPAQEAHGGLLRHRAPTLLAWTRSSRSRADGTNGATGPSRCPRTSYRASSTRAASRAPAPTGSRGRSSS